MGAGGEAALAETCTTEDARGGSPVTERDGPVAGVPGEGQIVGDDHGAPAGALTGDRGRNPALALGILAGSGLVEDEDGRPGCHGRGDRHQTLRLRRQIARVRALEIGELDDGQRLARPVIGVASRDAEHSRPKRDLLENGAREELPATGPERRAPRDVRARARAPRRAVGRSR